MILTGESGTGLVALHPFPSYHLYGIRPCPTPYREAVAAFCPFPKRQATPTAWRPRLPTPAVRLPRAARGEAAPAPAPATLPSRRGGQSPLAPASSTTSPSTTRTPPPSYGRVPFASCPTCRRSAWSRNCRTWGPSQHASYMSWRPARAASKDRIEDRDRARAAAGCAAAARWRLFELTCLPGIPAAA